jgi:hypothetical protein
MTVVCVPDVEVDGQPIQQGLFPVDNKVSFQVHSHRSDHLIVLRFLSRSISLNTEMLQDAIRDVVAKSGS